MKVLIIEDYEPVANIFSALMMMAGCEVRVEPDMRGAFEALRTQWYDCALLDLDLPDSHTEKTLRLIPTLLEGVGKVVVMTAAPPNQVYLLAKESGASECFYKGDLAVKNKILELLNSE